MCRLYRKFRIIRYPNRKSLDLKAVFSRDHLTNCAYKQKFEHGNFKLSTHRGYFITSVTETTLLETTMGRFEILVKIISIRRDFALPFFRFTESHENIERLAEESSRVFHT